jgi:hypothetical protein
MACIIPPLQGVAVAQPAPVIPIVPVVQAPGGLQLVPPPVLERKPKTFQQFNEDTSKDPCNGDYTHIMDCFDPEPPK